METSHGGQPWKPTMEASHGGQPWRPATEASHRGQPWRPATEASHRGQSWRPATEASHGGQPQRPAMEASHKAGAHAWRQKAGGLWVVWNDVGQQESPVSGGYLSLRQLTVKYIQTVRSWAVPSYLSRDHRPCGHIHSAECSSSWCSSMHGKDFWPLCGWERSKTP